MLYLISGLMFNLFENYMNGKNIIKFILKFGIQPGKCDFVHVVRVLTKSWSRLQTITPEKCSLSAIRLVPYRHGGK